ncbi:MAG: TRAP transporter substrate-binding protein DctP [Spirochaetes bacterium]|nr:TRAP transporter substrate-binding protein DctP [Spirochaetota bacterium]
MKKKLLLVSMFLTFSVFVSQVIMQNHVFAKKPVRLRLVIATPKGDWPQTYRDEEMAKRFNARAKGQYQIDVLTGSAVAKLPEFFDAVRVGIVEMQFSNWGTFSFLDSRLGLLEVPFFFASNKATNSSMEKMLPLFDPILQQKFNAKGLAMINTGGLGLWTQKPVKTLSDLKGMMIGSVSPVTSILIEHLGASPVTIPFMDLYESMQKKIIDGAAQSAHGGVVFHFPDVCKHFTAFYGVPAPAGYTINLKVWNNMPKFIQTILLEETQKAAEWMHNVVVSELPDKDLKAFSDKGVKVYFMPANERAKWAERLESYRNKELLKYGDLGKKLKKISEEANKKYPYVADKTAI